ncbi:glycosyl transferase [Halalkaliarchaeum desulfuricum]|uniref:Glycosyl transferase n=2 Tax=Halalkaliarchaeum desulfuricum TaxID=2055893 RepID=A0A343TN65_9EURY|nr:glycosyl transferase [Halalkaliarchaeum desulfuricum]
MDPDWLENAILDMKTKGAHYLACSVSISSTTDNGGFIERYDRALSIPVKHYIEEYHFAPTAALLLTRGLIEEVGTFDPELTSGEDREFGNRVYERGYELYVSDCEVYHPPRKKVSDQTQKAIRIGVGMEQLRRQYPDRYSLPSLMSPLSYAPPNPKRLRSRLSSNSYKPDFLEWMLFYLFNYFLKLYQQLGRWQHFRNR